MNYFEKYEDEKEFDTKLLEKLNVKNVHLKESIFFSEKLNFIYTIFSQIRKLEIYINHDILEVATRQYSKFYFPELTHMSFDAYVTDFSVFLENISYYIKKNNAIVCDLGCGIAKIAYYLCKRHSNISKYYAVDNDSLIIELNEKYLAMDKIEYLCADVFELNIYTNVDYIFVFNFFKYYQINEIDSILERILLKSNQAKVLIYDKEDVINALVGVLKKDIRVKRINSFFCILESESI